MGKVDPGKPDPHSNSSPLYDAAENGHQEIARTLLSHPSIDVNKGSYGSTPLYAASEKGHSSVVESLLAHPNINVNKVVTLDGTTALGIASYHGHVEVVRLILRCPRADATITSDSGQSGFLCKTALDYAREKGFQEIIEAFQSRTDLQQLGNTC